METGCSDLYGVIYDLTIQYYPDPLHPPPNTLTKYLKYTRFIVRRPAVSFRCSSNTSSSSGSSSSSSSSSSSCCSTANQTLDPDVRSVFIIPSRKI